VNVNTDDPEARAMVRAYLDRLRAVSGNLPPERRDELLAEVREHIDAALAADPHGGREVAARNVLDRLGSPEEIVRAESEGALPAPPGPRPLPAPPASPWGGLEIAAVVALAIGGMVLPMMGPLVGLVLAWSSSRWTTAQKLVASALALLPVLLLAPVVLIA
jgi:hypothetical protein